MARYQMEDGTVLDTDNARAVWGECQDFDGRNHLGRSSRSQWHHESLYASRKGRYYLEHRSSLQGQRDWCEWISPQQAAAWLMLNEKKLPEALAAVAEDITE